MTDERHGRKPAVQSMTGYAHCVAPTDPAVTVELRGVNARFLDIVLRMPDELRAIEPALRELLREGLTRGKVECRINLPEANTAAGADPDPAALQAIAATLARLKEAIPALAPPSASDLLRLPALFARPPDIDALQTRALTLAGEALQQFIASRQSEGARLAALVGGRLTEVADIALALRGRAPAFTAAFEARLAERLEAALGSAAGAASLPAAELAARVTQEVTVYGLRADVAEEIDRLLAHVDECRQRLAGPGPVGKRLDFLMQELNREANTLGSKANALELTRAAVDLKVLIEQIREQVQNLE